MKGELNEKELIMQGYGLGKIVTRQYIEQEFDNV